MEHSEDLDALSSAMAERVKAWIVEKFPANTAAKVADAIGCDRRTAEKWLGSPPKFPINRHFAKMAALWGQRFLATAFEPAIGPISIPDTDDAVELNRRYEIAQSMMEEISALIDDMRSVIATGRPVRVSG